MPVAPGAAAPSSEVRHSGTVEAAAAAEGQGQGGPCSGSAGAAVPGRRDVPEGEGPSLVGRGQKHKKN